MHPRRSMWMLLAGALAAASAGGAEVSADAPTDLSVTVYRSPYRGSGSIDLDRLRGFALISETRTVRLPAGMSRVRFEGVADGIEPASAIVTGLPEGIIEKNREGALLSPSALMQSAAGRPVTLLRSNPKTGNSERLPGRILADAGGGVVFETPAGIEALRCSGLAESFSFDSVADLSATPTLSVLVRSRDPVTATVTLAYLARGFDWAADYTATLSADGTTMDLGAWVTLANGNGIGFAGARTQVVAGRVNRESGEIEPIDAGGPILASCWPRGSTSDSAALLQIDFAAAGGHPRAGRAVAALALAPQTADMMQETQRVEQEQLGDLKLYRVPERTTVASRQSKQVRLLDRAGIPITIYYGADLAADASAPAAPAFKLLRTLNDAANHLGLPLPSGSVAVYAEHRGERLLERESGIRDLAVGEELEINLGAIPDVEVTALREGADAQSAPRTGRDVGERIEISNARSSPIQFELLLRLPEGARIVGADHPVGQKNGRPIFRLAIPAHASATLRYEVRHGAG
ncbi:MAG: hypothetical protein WA807_08880 [Steroidobacteraceae bacterium]